MSDNIERRIWVLGAPDPEMERIEGLLRECGETVVYATTGDGERVTPATAYRCPVPEAPEGATVYAVECIDVLPDGWVRIDHHRPGDPGYGRPPSEFLAASSIGQVISELAGIGQLSAWPEAEWPYRVYGRPHVGVHEIRWSVGSTPRYLACVAGSATREVRVGQILSPDELGTRDVYTREPVVSRICEIPAECLLVAAADHCLGAAYRGECPGVDPDALMRWRAESRARFLGRPVEEVLADVERARAALAEAPAVDLTPDRPVRDLREAYTVSTVLVAPFADGATVDAAGVGDSVTIEFGAREEGAWDEGSHHTFVRRGVPELPDAASREGVAYLAYVDRDGSGRQCRPKVVLGGCTTPEMVRAFLGHWAPSQGLVDAYGDPERGFAGAYYPTEVAS